mgnify:CR=1 FL=1
MFEHHLHLIKNVVDLRQSLFELVRRSLLLDVVQSRLDIQDLYFDHVHYFFALVV